MYLRRWLAIPLAAPIVLAILGAPAAEASIGVGVQMDPVRLTVVARPGESYALPPVYIVNTGTQTESISLRVERLSRGSGQVVPPSWIHGTGTSVTLESRQSARIPLQLAVPGGAKSGGYLSDIVVLGSAGVVPGKVNFGVGAATKLQFSVGSAPRLGVLSFLPPWTRWAMGTLILLAITIAVLRESGLRIRVERKSTAASSANPQRRYRAG
jgi:hypothetical protein